MSRDLPAGARVRQEGGSAASAAARSERGQGPHGGAGGRRRRPDLFLPGPTADGHAAHGPRVDRGVPGRQPAGRPDGAGEHGAASGLERRRNVGVGAQGPRVRRPPRRDQRAAGRGGVLPRVRARGVARASRYRRRDARRAAHLPGSAGQPLPAGGRAASSGLRGRFDAARGRAEPALQHRFDHARDRAAGARVSARDPRRGARMPGVERPRSRTSCFSPSRSAAIASIGGCCRRTSTRRPSP